MSISPNDAKTLFAQITENNRLLRSCRAHRFVVVPYHIGIYVQRFACANCSGTMRYDDIRTYADGFVAGGGHIKDVMLEVSFD